MSALVLAPLDGSLPVSLPVDGLDSKGLNEPLLSNPMLLSVVSAASGTERTLSAPLCEPPPVAVGSAAALASACASTRADMSGPEVGSWPRCLT